MAKHIHDINMKNYIPSIKHNPIVWDKYASAWGDIPTILKDIILRFKIKNNLCLEFGVEYGYSTSALSNYFKKIIGVDTFLGDVHTGPTEDHYERTKNELSAFKNIELVKSDFRDFTKIEENNIIYDLIHIDIVHTYSETYECGEWSVLRSPITIFHDTESFEDVKQVCLDLSNKYNLDFYNYPYSNGLGILINNKILKSNMSNYLRFDVINYLISVNNYKSFLEIGTQEHINLSNIIIDKKISVDPDPEVNADFILPSDDFFEQNTDKFDIIFVDGLHHADFVYRDMINSLKILNPGGCVVVHDVIPNSFESQLIPLEKTLETGSGIWNGDVWKGWVKLRTERKDLIMKVINTDHGCGIIHSTKYGSGDYLESYNNGYYEYNKDLIFSSLNLISCDEFLSLFDNPISKDYHFI